MWQYKLPLFAAYFLFDFRNVWTIKELLLN